MDGADIVAIFEQVGGKRVTQGVGCDSFLDTGQVGGTPDDPLQAGHAGMVAALNPRAGVNGDTAGGENVLPAPLGAAAQLAVEGVRQVDASQTFFEAGTMDTFNAHQVVLDGFYQVFGEHRDAILAAFTIPDSDLQAAKIEILDAQPDAFHDAHTAAVHQAGHETVRADEVDKESLDFSFGEHGGDAG